MTESEILQNMYEFVIENELTFEERRSMGVDRFHKFVEENYEPVPKAELEVGKTYRGNCRNTSSAVWDGKEFKYQRYKLGDYYEDILNHFEDDDGYDVFVPIRMKKIQENS